MTVTSTLKSTRDSLILPSADIIATSGMDGTARIWDIKTQKNAIAIPAHPQEVLTCDFSKYEDLIVTGSGDNTIRLWVSTTPNLPLGP